MKLWSKLNKQFINLRLSQYQCEVILSYPINYEFTLLPGEPVENDSFLLRPWKG